MPEVMQIKLQGHSMKPSLRNNDQLGVELFEEPQALQKFNQGETILLRFNGEWIVHRVVCSREGKKTKGDWSICFDEKSKVWGRVATLNGKADALLNNSIISFLSSRVHHKATPLKRKIFKSLLIAYVYIKRR